MNKKKALLMALSLVLVCVMSVMGTVAYLQMSTQTPVVNTFVAAGGGKLADAITLTEHVVTKGTDGSYTIADDAATTPTNTYDVMPGMDLPKDPYITITNKTEAPAYLYVEVVSGLDTAYEWTMDNVWMELTGVTGSHGGKVYVYEGTAAAPAATDTALVLTNTNTPDSINIIAGKNIDVKTDAELTADSLQLTFYAYLAQSTIGNDSTAASVYTACWPYTAPAEPENP